MFTLHANQPSRSFLDTAQRLFRRPSPQGLLAPDRLNAHTLRDIGVNPVGLN